MGICQKVPVLGLKSLGASYMRERLICESLRYSTRRKQIFIGFQCLTCVKVGAFEARIWKFNFCCKLKMQLSQSWVE